MLVSAGLISCGDFLTRDPKGAMEEEEFFSSANAGLRTVVKCCQSLNSFFGFKRPVMDIGNIATDDAEKGGSGAGDGLAAAELSFGRATSVNADLNNFWQEMYRGIANCNIALENIPVRALVDDAGYEISDEVRGRYIGEVTFLRAYYYFELCMVFGGVPLIDHTLTVDDGKSLRRASESETADFILNELSFAETNPDIPSKSVLPISERGRITKEAVWALQAKVYMYFAKDNPDYFALGRDAAKKVIDSGNYRLEPNFQDLFLPDNYSSDESIFINIWGDAPDLHIYGSSLSCYAGPRSCGAYGFDQPTQNLVDEFEEGEPRLLYTIMQPDNVFPKGKDVETLDFSTYPNTGYHNRKVFLVSSRRGLGWGDDAWTRHVIRYADILLLYAEAVIETGGDKAEAVQYINMVRIRANNSRGGDAEAKSRVLIVPKKNIPMVNINDDLKHAVRHERRIKLAMEYNRYYDLKRWNIYIETMNAFSADPNSNGRGAGFHKGINEVLPIPQSEIDRTNGSIVQNYGYN